MLEQKPYFIKAIYDWIVDSGCTPYLQVVIHYPGVVAPQGFDEDGILVLNISHQATNQLQINNDFIGFWARFRGQPMAVHIPMGAVLAIFAKENAQGMAFPPPDIEKAISDAEKITLEKQENNNITSEETTKRDRGHLRIIK